MGEKHPRKASGFKKYGTLLLLMLAGIFVQAQDKLPVGANPDSVALDSARVDSQALESANQAQQLILQQAQQSMIDSLIREQLGQEMSSLNTDSKRRKELEAQLAEMHQQDSVRKAVQLAEIARLKEQSPGFGVVPFSDTLFYIYTKVGSFKAAERADIISGRIKKIYKYIDFSPDSLQIQANDDGYDIVYGSDQEIMSVTNLDAIWNEVSPKELAESYLGKIRNEIVKEQDDNSVFNWVKRIGLVILIVVCVLGLIWIIRKLFRIGELYIHKNKDKVLKGISFRNFTVLKPEQELNFVIRIIRILRTVTIVIAIYLALPLLFSVFPETKIYANTLIGWVLSPAKRAMMGILHFLPNLFTIVVIFFLTRYAIRAVKFFATEIEEKRFTLPGFHEDWAKPTFNIVKFIMYAFMFVIIWPYLPGSDSPAFQGVSVFLGILLSLGSSSAITNMVAGLVITYMRPFKIGDRVKIGEVTGDVLEKTMLVTRIRTIKNEDITVPNATVLNSSTINYSASSLTMGLILHTTVTIGYDVPWRKMHQVLIDAAGRTKGVMKDPKPFVLQTSLDDFYVSYQLNCYTNEASRQAVLYSLLHQNIQDCCNEADVEILSPHFRAQRDGSSLQIPADYIPSDYIAPAFRVQQVVEPAAPNIPSAEE